MGLLPLSSPYFIRVPRHFLLLSAKIRKNIGICKFIEKIVQIVETSSIYINKEEGCIDKKCHLFSDNGRLLRNNGRLLVTRPYLLRRKAAPLKVRGTGSLPYAFTQNNLCHYSKAFVPIRKIASPIRRILLVIETKKGCVNDTPLIANFRLGYEPGINTILVAVNPRPWKRRPLDLSSLRSSATLGIVAWKYSLLSLLILFWNPVQSLQLSTCL